MVVDDAEFGPIADAALGLLSRERSLLPPWPSAPGDLEWSTTGSAAW
jgi:hypothetical protein